MHACSSSSFACADLGTTASPLRGGRPGRRSSSRPSGGRRTSYCSRSARGAWLRATARGGRHCGCARRSFKRRSRLIACLMIGLRLPVSWIVTGQRLLKDQPAAAPRLHHVRNGAVGMERGGRFRGHPRDRARVVTVTNPWGGPLSLKIRARHARKAWRRSRVSPRRAKAAALICINQQDEVFSIRPRGTSGTTRRRGERCAGWHLRLHPEAVSPYVADRGLGNQRGYGIVAPAGLELFFERFARASGRR
jgi:hypothetical protein